MHALLATKESNSAVVVSATTNPAAATYRHSMQIGGRERAGDGESDAGAPVISLTRFGTSSEDVSISSSAPSAFSSSKYALLRTCHMFNERLAITLYGDNLPLGYVWLAWRCERPQGKASSAKPGQRSRRGNDGAPG